MKSALRFPHAHICSLTAGHGWHFRVRSARHDLISHSIQRYESAECQQRAVYQAQKAIHPAELKENSGFLLIFTRHVSSCLIIRLNCHLIDTMFVSVAVAVARSN